MADESRDEMMTDPADQESNEQTQKFGRKARQRQRVREMKQSLLGDSNPTASPTKVLPQTYLLQNSKKSRGRPILRAMNKFRHRSKTGKYPDTANMTETQLEAWCLVAATLHVGFNYIRMPTMSEIQTTMEESWSTEKIQYAIMEERHHVNPVIRRLKESAEKGEIDVPEDVDAWFWENLAEQEGKKDKQTREESMRMKKEAKRIKIEAARLARKEAIEAARFARKEAMDKGQAEIAKNYRMKLRSAKKDKKVKNIEKAKKVKKVQTQIADVDGMDVDQANPVTVESANHASPAAQQQLGDFNWESMVDDMMARLTVKD